MIQLPLHIEYSDKVVVVTGAGGLICSAMVRAFARSGAKVAALDLNEEAVTGLAAELTDAGFICKGYKADVLDGALLETVHRQVLSDLGPCDILLNGAGGNNPRATTDNEYQHEARKGDKTFFDLSADGVDFVFRLNFQGTLIPTQVFAADMVERRSGCILNISSMNAFTPRPRSRLLGSQGRRLQFYSVAGYTLCRNRHTVQCHCSRLPDIGAEPLSAL